MEEYLKDRLRVHLRRAAMAVLASGAVAATTFPALAQQTSEAMNPGTKCGQGQDAALELQDAAFTVAGEANGAPPGRDYPVIDTLTAYELGRIFDVKRVKFIHPMMMIPPN
jgi:hypothetical protein